MAVSKATLIMLRAQLERVVSGESLKSVRGENQESVRHSPGFFAPVNSHFSNEISSDVREFLNLEMT
jgi:hypothetical protein